MSIFLDFLLTIIALAIAFGISLYANKYQDIVRSVKTLSMESVIYMAMQPRDSSYKEAQIKYMIQNLSKDLKLWAHYESVATAMVKYRHDVMGDKFESVTREPADVSLEISNLEAEFFSELRRYRFPISAWVHCIGQITKKLVLRSRH